MTKCVYAKIHLGYCFDCARYQSCNYENKASQAENDRRAQMSINQGPTDWNDILSRADAS